MEIMHQQETKHNEMKMMTESNKRDQEDFVKKMETLITQIASQGGP